MIAFHRVNPKTALLVVLVAIGAAAPATGCKPKPKGGTSSSSNGPMAASTSPASTSSDDYTPAHPGHRNQRAGSGYAAAVAPPSATARSAFLANGFNKPPATTKLVAPKAGAGHCGELDLGGGQKVYLDCADADYGTVKSASKAMVSHASLSGTTARKLPAIVDHRKDGTDGPILNQGPTLACTSFSLVGTVNQALTHFLGHPGNLSPMHAWARYHTPQMGLADEMNDGHGLTDLAHAPFDPNLAVAWQQNKAPVDPTFLQRADAATTAQITNITALDITDMGEIKSALAAGQDVWFALRAAHGIQKLSKMANGESVVPDFDWHQMPSSQQMGHAIVLAGYEDTPHGTYFLIHNSWGTNWGTKGYAWIWDKTLKANISAAYTVHAQPGANVEVKVPPAVHKFASCASGLAPDGVTSQCVPTCPDGGPRANGVCPIAGSCPDGEVNLFGACQPAAPTLDKTLDDGLKVRCGASGCTYVVPSGKAGCTSGNGCAVSCPSPHFRLANGPRGLSCTG